MGVELSGPWGTSCDSALPGMVLYLLSLFLPFRGQMLVTSHYPEKCLMPQVSALILEDAEQQLLFPSAGILESRGSFQAHLHWFPHAHIPSPCHSHGLSFFWLDIPKQWQKQGDKYCRVLEPAVRLNYTNACKSEQNLICAFYWSLPLPTPRFWISSKDSLFQNKK